MDNNMTAIMIIAMLCGMSIVKSYFNSKTKHFVVGEIDRLRERIEALERRGP